MVSALVLAVPTGRALKSQDPVGGLTQVKDRVVVVAWAAHVAITVDNVIVNLQRSVGRGPKARGVACGALAVLMAPKIDAIAQASRTP